MCAGKGRCLRRERTFVDRRLLVFLVICAQPVISGPVSQFDITEELPTRSFVGSVRTNPDVVDVLNLTASNGNSGLLRFDMRYPSSPTASLFSIDERTGDLRTSRRIDREQLCPNSDDSDSPSCSLSFDVTVLPVRYFRIIRVRVNVADINDNAPTFGDDARRRIEIRENVAAGTQIPLPAAEDPDSGDFSVNRYEMSAVPTSADYPFRLTVRGSGPSADVFLTVTGRLDRETKSSYTLRLTAIDGGRPPKSGSIEINVVVSDANDNGPRFDQTMYEAETFEDQPVGSTIVRVRATDPDEGPNGEVMYRISDQSPISSSASGGAVSSDSAAGAADRPFAINNRTGSIYLVGELDYERQTGYQLTVVATDLGVGSLPAYARVTIHIGDVNDNRPEIVVNSLTDSGRAEVAENADPGAFVAFISARDSDSGKNGAVDCVLQQQQAGYGINDNNNFRLEPVSGSNGDFKLITTSVLDREAADLYFAMIRCSDNGSPTGLSSTAEVEIHVIDENDMAPSFESPLYAVAVPEGNEPGVVVARMNATDGDIGVNAFLTYSMLPVSGTPEGAADIDVLTGTVYAVISFDYETRKEYRYRVTATDGGKTSMSGTASLVIRIVDVNDERPLFDRPSYHFSISENRPVGSSVGKVHATDTDVTASFSRIMYSILQGDGAFEMDPVTGALTTARRLDREETAVYELTVRASNPPSASPGDGSSSGLFSSATITINVEDENDNTPIIRHPSPVGDRLVLRVPVTAQIGTVLTRIEAHDPDDGPNGALVYTLTNGNEDGLFSVDRDTGTLTTARRLSESGRDGQPVEGRTFRLVITVRDRGTTERLAVVDLSVVVNGTAPYMPSVSGAVAASRLGVVGTDGGQQPVDEVEAHTTSSSSSSSSLLLSGGLFDSPQRVVIMATVISVGLFLIIIIVVAIVVGLVVCRWRRRRRLRKSSASTLEDRRRDDWIRQQTLLSASPIHMMPGSRTCGGSEAGCSSCCCAAAVAAAAVADPRSMTPCCGCRHHLHQHLVDAISLNGSMTTASFRCSSATGKERMNNIRIPSPTAGATLAPPNGSIPWSTSGLDRRSTMTETASGTERDDETENEDDVPLSSGLMMTSTSRRNGCRGVGPRDNDRLQSVGLLSGVIVDNASSSQRATPDVLRQASATTTSTSSDSGCCSVAPTAACTPSVNASSASRAGVNQSTAGRHYPTTGQHRHHHHHQARGAHQHRRRTKSPGGRHRHGCRPGSASSGGGSSSTPWRLRDGQQHTSRSDVEMSDLNGCDVCESDCSESFSESTTYRDSGMDHSEDSGGDVKLSPLSGTAGNTAVTTTLPLQTTGGNVLSSPQGQGQSIGQGQRANGLKS